MTIYKKGCLLNLPPNIKQLEIEFSNNNFKNIDQIIPFLIIYTKSLFARKFNEHDAEEIVQSVLQSIISNSRFNRVRGRFCSYFYICIKRRIIDFKRKNRCKEKSLLKYSIADKTVNITDQVKDFSTQIKPKYKDLYNMWIHNIPYQEISYRLDMPMGTVKRNIHDMKRNLQELVKIPDDIYQ